MVLICSPSNSFAQTNINSSPTTDTLWTTTGSPYLVHANLTVGDGIILKIEPGVSVVFDSAKYMNITGRLVAAGSPEEPIIFTGAAQTQGYWVGLQFYAAKTGHATGSSLSFSKIEYGGKNNGNIYINDATVDIVNCEISNSLTNGVYVYSKGAANISETNIINNKTNAIYHYSAGIVGRMTNLSASGNGLNAVVLNTGYISSVQYWDDSGLPYFVMSGAGVYVRDVGTLNIQPGCEVVFDSNAVIASEGTLLVNGTKENPVLFTGKEKTPGYWKGLRFESVPNPVKNTLGAAFTISGASRIEYLNIEYAGGGTDTYKSNIHIENMRAYISHCSIKNSAQDGVSALNAGGSVIEFSQITDNAGMGLANYNATLNKQTVIAANNWWGDASGPYSANCNPAGLGSSITDFVIFSPFLKTADETPELCAPLESKTLSISPLKWYCPADGVNPVYVKLTLRDGAGNPLSGYKTHLTSTRGAVADGALTDAFGECYARVVSKSAGSATLTAELTNPNGCEYVLSQTSEITFTTQQPSNGALLELPEAPYMCDKLKVSPLPIIKDTPTTISVNMTNPYDIPILVDATFEIAQFGIGLVFGPIATIEKQRIEAKSSAIISALWLPQVSGHYCVKMGYSFIDAPSSGTLNAAAPRGPNSGSVQKNLDVKEAGSGSDNEDNILKKAKDIIGILTKLPILPKGLNVPSFLFNKLLGWQLETAEQISGSLQGNENSTGKPKKPIKFGNDDPGDYKQTKVPPKMEPPHTEPGDWYRKSPTAVTVAEAEALNAYFESMTEVIYYGRAYIITMLRYQAALAAYDRPWYSIQASAAEYYKNELGKFLIKAGNDLMNVLEVIKNEGFGDVIITPQFVADYQTTLSLTGFSPEDKDAAYSCGLTDEMLEAIKFAQLAIDPNTQAGSLFQWFEDVANALKELGGCYIINIFPSGQITGIKKSDSLAPDSDTTNNLVKVYSSNVDFYVANPLSAETAITLSLRNIDIPNDWTVSINPKSATIKPGEMITATVAITAGTAAVQGTTPRIAVEGYASGSLIGGVVIDVAVPEKRIFPFPPVVWMMY